MAKSLSSRPKPLADSKPVIFCPYCHSSEIIKKGTRKKKYETVQVYSCRRCERRFTPLISKHRTYPLKVILDSLTLYNRFYSLEDTAKLVSGTYGLKVGVQTISNWLRDYREYLPILRLRDTIVSQYDTRKIFLETRLLHGQIYDYKCHSAKLDLLINQYRAHWPFRSLFKLLLETIPTLCPHKLFREAAKKQKRSSQHKELFDIDEVRITPKPTNAAVKTARFVLQAVANNKLRHETLQEFMLVNDSVTVAVEVPVLLQLPDIEHFQKRLHFHVPIDLKPREVLTGHIDILQIRNGLIHILDFKPNAKNVKPIEQLTIYALALSRLSGLPLYHFKCAWFDDSNYFEFFPLHVVHKRRGLHISRPIPRVSQ